MAKRPLRSGLTLAGLNSVPQMRDEARPVEAVRSEVMVASRVALAKAELNDPFYSIELRLGFFKVSIDDLGDPHLIRLSEHDVSQEEVRKLLIAVDATVAAAVERIRRLRKEVGANYVLLNKSAGTSWESLEKLIAALRYLDKLA